MMKNKEKWYKKNQVFLLISLAVILTAFISVFSDCIGKNPFVTEEYLDNPVQVYTEGDKRYFISESSAKISVTDENYRLQYVIEGDDGDTSFSYADAIVVDKDGYLYIHDKLFTDNGSYAYEERIMKFSPKGEREEILYDIETLDEDGRQDIYLDSLKIWNDTVYFTQIEQEGIYVYSIKDEKVEECGFMPLENASDVVADTSVNGTMEIAAVMMNGDVHVWKDNKDICIYSAREHDTDDYFSLIAELAYGDDGILYLCDVGLRQVYGYDFENKSMETVISTGQFGTLDTDVYAENPIYSGINSSNGMLSVQASEYIYDEATDEEIYTYRIIIVGEDGEPVYESDVLQLPKSQNVLIIIVYIAALMLAALFVYALVKMIILLKESKPDQSIKTQLIMIVTALAVTLGVSYLIFDNCNQRFIDEAADKLTNVAYLIGENLDKDALEGIVSPDAYGTPEYEALDESVHEILLSKVNDDSGLYCVIYKVKNDVVCEAYRDDLYHGPMYPMAGRYTGAIEEYIAQENDYDVCYEFTLSEGTYMYALVPVYNDDGEAIAFIETGMDYTTFTDDNKALYTKVLMLAVMAVIIIMLLYSELLHGFNAVAINKKERQAKKICPPELIRPLSFLFFVIANMSTAFLPIYGMELWNDSFPIRAEIAAALPLSAELTFAAIAAFGCGFLIRKIGVKMTCAFGAIFYVAGNILSAFSPNLWVLISANAICGIGSGFLTIAFNSWAASYEDESMQNKGFIHINAAYLAGLNCGTVIGSVIWENFGVSMVYFVAAVAAVALMLLSLWFVGKINVVPEEDSDEGTGKLKDLFTPKVVRYFICICVPYLICTAFLEYFFPIEAELNGLSATHISMAFLLSGLVSIYIGSSLAEPITEKMGTKKAMILASFIYAAALFYLVINPTILSCYIVVIFFAIADSFGLSAQSVYYSSMDDVKKVGQSKALGVNSTVESITSACGSLIFGAALLLGTQKGIFVIASIFVVLMIIFVIGERKKH